MKFICGKFDLQLSDDMEKKKNNSDIPLIYILNWVRGSCCWQDSGSRE